VTGWNNWSAHVMLLPYLEQGAFFNAINFAGWAAAPGTPLNRTVQQVTLSDLLCPSDLDRLTAPYGHVNYCATAGTDHNFAPKGAPSGLFAQAPYSPAAIGFSGILDGLGQTAAMSERVKGLAKAAIRAWWMSSSPTARHAPTSRLLPSRSGGRSAPARAAK
jgi:hypothetical protein